MLNKIFWYLREGLWNFPLYKETGRRRFFLKSLRIAVLSIRDFLQDECMLHASSLTYYTIMATVPVLAMSFAIARGFGFHDFLRDRILLHFEQNHDVFLEILTFVDRMIEQAKGGIIAGMGIIILFWSITQLLSNLENSMNQIWKVRKLRSWRRIFSDYFALMLLGPCLLFLSLSASVFFVNEVSRGLQRLHLSHLVTGTLVFVAKLVPYCLFWFLFTFVYLFMPNKKVPFPSALLGGVVGGTIYLLVQLGYFYFQFLFNNIGTIYGSFAAFPLFLIWVQVSWCVLLFGAEVSFAHQTLDMHEYEDRAKRVSFSYKRLLSLWIIHLAVSKFVEGNGFLTREMILVRYQIPYALAAPIVEELIVCGLLLDTPKGLIPSKPAESLRMSDVIEALDAKGASDFPFIDATSLAPFEKALESFRAQIESSPANRHFHKL